MPYVNVGLYARYRLIGVALVSDRLGQHIPRGHIYFAMAFSVVVEMLNLRVMGFWLGTPRGSGLGYPRTGSRHGMTGGTGKHGRISTRCGRLPLRRS